MRPRLRFAGTHNASGSRRHLMDSIIYLVGLVVVIMAVLSFLGLR
jgi:hypothetical protein